MRVRFLACAALLALSVTSIAAGLPAGITQGPSVEGVTQYQLANGLKVVLFPDATKPTTTVNIVYLVGSRFEGYGETGMAHLLEHMLFKGTPSLPSVFTELGKRGMRFNGTTSLDRTHYYESFAANDDNLDFALRTEAERMTHSTFSKAELDSEMTVVRNEYESGENNPFSVLLERMQSVMFDWHNYGHATIGARSDIENVPFANLRAFYARYYQPDNAVLVVAGKFDVDATLALIARYFGAIAKPTRVLAPLYTVEPVQDGERSVTVRRVGSDQALAVAFHTPPGPTADDVAMEALTSIMSVAPSGRLYKSLVDTHLAADIGAQNNALHDPGYAMFFAQIPVTDAPDKARDAMVATLTGVKSAPVTAEELDRVRAKALKSFTETLNDPQRFAIAITSAIAQGDWRLFFVGRDRWRALKPEDVTRVAVDYLKPSNMTVGEFRPDAAPDRAPLVATPDVAAIVNDYKGDAAATGGEAFDTSIASLEARTERFTLANGLAVALLPHRTRGATVDVGVRLNFGDEQSLAGQSTVASGVGGMLSKGAARHDRQAFEDALDRMQARLSFNADGQVAEATGRTTREHLSDFLDLLSEALQTPTFAADETDKLKRSWLADIESERTDPASIAQRALDRLNNPYPRGDLRYVPTVDEELAGVQALTPEALKAFHARFYGMNHGELVVSGDFDAAAVRRQVEERFGKWSSAAPYTRVPYPMIPNKPAALTFETPDKANATLGGKLSVPLNDVSADYPALLVANQVLGANTDSRIFLRVRVHDGLAYSVGTTLEPSHIDLNTEFATYAIFAPQNLDKVKSGFSEEFARVMKDGFTSAEVDAAKRSLLEARRRPRADDAALIRALATQAWLGRTWKSSGDLDAAIAAVTADSALAALRKYVNPADIAWVYAGDFKKKK